MTRTPPPPGYSKPCHLYGWPRQHTTAQMLDIAQIRRIRNLWWHTANDLITGLANGNTINIPPLGTFDIIAKTRTNYINPRNGNPVPPRRNYRIRYQASAYARAVVSGTTLPPAEWWNPLLAQAARKAQLEEEKAVACWFLMMRKALLWIGKGNDLRLRGLGVFKQVRLERRPYRNWKTGVLAMGPVRRDIDLAASESLYLAVEAGGTGYDNPRN